MSENCDLSNYEIAKTEADKVDEQIIAALKTGCSFRVEAGAGSGKTYSLNRVIKWIQANKWKDYRRKKQNVICITYTNAAVDATQSGYPKIHLFFRLPYILLRGMQLSNIRVF